jgi:hypothetical protein
MGVTPPAGEKCANQETYIGQNMGDLELQIREKPMQA